MIVKTTYDSPIGKMYFAADDGVLIGAWIEGQKYFPESLLNEAEENDDLEVFHKTKQWLNAYFAGKRPEISELNLSMRGSEFAKQVWNILCEIPYGETLTYGEIARKLAKMRGVERMSAQAIGGAVGHNPIAIIVPCHRVIGANGKLTGYAAGLDIKTKLLELEKNS